MRFDHAAVGAAETDEIRTRPLFLLPKDDGLAMLHACGASGKMSFLHFFADILNPRLTDADRNVVNAASECRDWCRLLAMKVNGSNVSKLACTPVEAATLADRQALNARMSMLRAIELAKLGMEALS